MSWHKYLLATGSDFIQSKYLYGKVSYQSNGRINGLNVDYYIDDVLLRGGTIPEHIQ